MTKRESIAAMAIILILGHQVFVSAYNRYQAYSPKPTMPTGRDERLLGTWMGDNTRATFFADGSGNLRTELRSPRVFEWGTTPTDLHVTFLAVDFWPDVRFSYRIDTAGKHQLFWRGR